ncbi:ROK family protein [Aquicoccus sp. SCR17]|nr:ROK family protein [Carideicomes alvinocaridis]
MPDSNLDTGTGPAPGCGPLGPGGRGTPVPLRQQVFERVRAAGQIARVEVAKELGISPATVTALASDLIAAGFIQEIATPRRDADSARGRPPVALGVQPGARIVAGIRLSEQTDSAVIMDFAGNCLAEAVRDHRMAQRDLAASVEAAETVLDLALSKSRIGREQLHMVGVGLPGLIDMASGRALWSPLLEDRDMPLAAALERQLGVPVRIDNDANLVTLAELWFGAGRGLSDFAVVTIEEGLGMGLVVDHQLYRGGGGHGMELAHIKVQLDGALCRCGQRGCLEAYISDYALIREARTALNLGNRGVKSPQALLETLYDNAKAGNQAARAIFGRAGRYLALGLGTIVNLFDPKVILLSGERLRYDYLYAEEVLAEMRAFTLNTGGPAPKIEIHAWGGLVWATGAAALALDCATAEALGGEAVAA